MIEDLTMWLAVLGAYLLILGICGLISDYHEVIDKAKIGDDARKWRFEARPLPKKTVERGSDHA